MSLISERVEFGLALVQIMGVSVDLLAKGLGTAEPWQTLGSEAQSRCQTKPNTTQDVQSKHHM